MANSVMKSVLTKALQAFKLRPAMEGESSEVFLSELTNLQDSVRALTAEDLNLEDTIRSIPKSSQLPVTFVDIFENPLLTMMVIIMKPGSRIPLHDHPNMYGMIKVLAGQVRVQSYTLLDEPAGKSMDHNGHKNAVMSALRMPETILSKVSSPITLSPEIRNVHEIQCISGETVDDYAAFLDILSPPYPDADSCHYFKAEEHMQKSDGSGELRKCRLVQTECPEDYFTACASLGPF